MALTATATLSNGGPGTAVMDFDESMMCGDDSEECEEIVELLLQDDPFDTEAAAAFPESNMMITSDLHQFQTPRQVSEGSQSKSATTNDGATTTSMMMMTDDNAMVTPPLLKLTGRPPISLYLSCNPDYLSPYQVEIRKQIQFFEATPEYVNGQHVKGRNKAIVLGQVGVQCRHCAHVTPPQTRAKGSTYFPQKLLGIYQAAQILSTTHLLESCPLVPPAQREHLKQLQQSSKASRTAGKDYWASTAQSVGVFQDEHGLRFEHRMPTYDEVLARHKAMESS
eukprot:scaffold3563_cov70-Cylindrotheca_fusiformis.AAC.4